MDTTDIIFWIKRTIPHHMIRHKIILTIAISTLLLIAGAYTISSVTLIQSHHGIENEQVIRDIDRVRNSLETYFIGLAVTLHAWAEWDDSYQFVQDGNTEFIETNLGNTKLANLEVDLIAYVNTQNGIVYSNRTNPSNEGFLPSDTLVQAILGMYGSQIPRNPGEELSGIIKTSEGLLFVEALPIRTSRNEGPVFGSILFGRFLDDAFIKKVSNLTQLPIEVFTYDSTKHPQDIIAAKENLSQGIAHVIQVYSEESVAGYFLIKGIDANPVAISRIIIPREIYIQGKGAITTSAIVFGISIILFGGILMLLLERLVLRRLTQLNTVIRKISEGKLENVSLPIFNDDEISRFVNVINELIYGLSTARKNEKEALRLERITAENLRKNLKQAEKVNYLLINREVRMVDLKQEIIELKKKLEQE